MKMSLEKYNEIRRRIQRLKNNVHINSVIEQTNPFDPLEESTVSEITKLCGIIYDYYISINSDGTRSVKVLQEDGKVCLIDIEDIPKIINEIELLNPTTLTGVVSAHGKIREEIEYINGLEVEYNWIKCTENIMSDPALDNGLSKKYNKINKSEDTYQVFTKLKHGTDLGVVSAYNNKEGVIKAVVKSTYCPTECEPSLSLPTNDDVVLNDSKLRISKSMVYWGEWKFKYNRDYDNGLVLYQVEWKDKLLFTRFGLSLQDTWYQPLDPQFVWANRHTTPLKFSEGMRVHRKDIKSAMGKGVVVNEMSDRLELKFELYHPLSDITYEIVYHIKLNGIIEIFINISGESETRYKTSEERELFGVELSGLVIPYIQYTFTWRITLANKSQINKVTPSRIKINDKNPYGNAIVWARYPVNNTDVLGKKRGEYWEIEGIAYMIKPIITDTDIISRPSKDIEIDGRAVSLRMHYITDASVKYGLNGSVRAIISPT